jgi:hypothetical protein
VKLVLRLGAVVKAAVLLTVDRRNDSRHDTDAVYHSALAVEPWIVDADGPARQQGR